MNERRRHGQARSAGQDSSLALRAASTCTCIIIIQRSCVCVSAHHIGNVMYFNDRIRTPKRRRGEMKRE